MRKRRHPIRGAVSGLLLGLGAALVTIIYGINVLGPLTPWLVVLAGVVVGLLVALFVPSRKVMRG